MLKETSSADLIDELVKNGKEVEAVYFASESGLTERFQPASLLKSYLRNSKKNTAEILKKGNHSAGATVSQLGKTLFSSFGQFSDHYFQHVRGSKVGMGLYRLGGVGGL